MKKVKSEHSINRTRYVILLVTFCPRFTHGKHGACAEGEREREEEGTDDDDEIHFLRHRVFHRVAKSTQHEPKGVRLMVAVVGGGIN